MNDFPFLPLEARQLLPILKQIAQHHRITSRKIQIIPLVYLAAGTKEKTQNLHSPHDGKG